LKSRAWFFLARVFALSAVVDPISTVLAAEFHVSDGNELYSVLFDEVGSNAEDDIVYLAAGTYYQSISDFPPRGGFIVSAGGDSLTIMGEPGTSASDVVIDAHGILGCLKIIDSSLHPSYTDLPYETIMDPAFDRPRIVVSGITFQNGDYEYDSGGLEIDADKYAVTVQNCIIKNNTSGAGRGGGLSISSAFNLVLENNQILDNSVRERRVITGSADHPVEGMESRGGGVFVWNAWNGIVARNNIVAGNVAMGDSSEGGGMYLAFSCGRSAQLINNTVYGNHANEGGGIHFTDIPSPGGTINLYNNIVYANTAVCNEGGADLFFMEPPGIAEGWRTTVNAYHNNFSRALGTITASDGNLDTDPLFVDAAARDFHLGPRSPMFNAGHNRVPDPPGLPVYDFEGDARVNGGKPDIGADEYYPTLAGGGFMSAGLDIRSDGKDGPVLIKPPGTARLTISVAANDDKGKTGTLWVAMSSPIGRYFLTEKGWVKEKGAYYQGPVKDMLPIDLPTPPPLTKAGNYEFWVGMEIKGPGKKVGKVSAKAVLSDSIVFHVSEEPKKKPDATKPFSKEIGGSSN
jgi:hypothetical protein